MSRRLRAFSDAFSSPKHMTRFLWLSALFFLLTGFSPYVNDHPRPVDVRDFGAKCDGTTDDSEALLSINGDAAVAQMGIYATCRISASISLSRPVYIGPQGALSVDTGKTLMVGNISIDSLSPFPGSGTVTASVFQQPSWPYAWQGNPVKAKHWTSKGTISTPDTSLEAALAVQKIGTQHASASENPAGWFGLVATDASNGHGTALIGYAEDSLAYSSAGGFIEGVRGDCFLRTGSTHGQCNGLVAEAGTDSGVVPQYLIGIEASTENRSNVAPSTTFSAGSFMASFLASCGMHGMQANEVNCENAFMMNPNSAQYTFLRGFFIPSGGHTLDPTNGRAIEIDAKTNTAIQLHFGSFTYPVTIPNGNGLWWANGANDNLYKGSYLNRANQMVLYDDSNGNGQMIFGRSGSGYAQFQNGQIRLPGAPTNCTGLPTGSVYSNAGVLTLCP